VARIAIKVAPLRSVLGHRLKCQFAADKFFLKEVTQKQATLLPR